MSLRRRLSPGVYPLAAAVILGAQDRLSRDDREPFVLSGSAHVLSVSGLHVGIIAGALLYGARVRVLPFRWSLWITIVLLVAYAELTEARAPVLARRRYSFRYCASLGSRVAGSRC